MYVCICNNNSDYQSLNGSRITLMDSLLLLTRSSPFSTSFIANLWVIIFYGKSTQRPDNDQQESSPPIMK